MLDSPCPAQGKHRNPPISYNPQTSGAAALATFYPAPLDQIPAYLRVPWQQHRFQISTKIDQGTYTVSTISYPPADPSIFCDLDVSLTLRVPGIHGRYASYHCFAAAPEGQIVSYVLWAGLHSYDGWLTDSLCFGWKTPRPHGGCAGVHVCG